ncbi:alpha/beta hydrolase [Paenibacillus sp. FSL R7-0297]|uniref:alpha/beta fold hydrolase n=1 Tax=unclassified Paenibacillus TaxID=185978 RepID=UPI00069439E0|nr:alpha/beta hydrolase [Paenibacillus sp. FSL R5-0912]
MIEERISLGQLAINVRYSLNGKPIILFLHFSGGNLNMWEGILPQFQQDYSIIAPDLRGHGKSDKPETGYHIDEMAEDMYRLLQHLQVDKCHIVGSSMGAEVGLSLAAAHPERVLSLVCEGALNNEFGEYGIFNGTAEEITQRKEQLRAELGEREERMFNSIEEYVSEQRAELTKEGLWNPYFSAFYENSLQQLPDGKYTYCYLNRVRTEYIVKYWDLSFEQYYHKIECPVLFLPSEEEWGDESIRRSLDAFAGLLDSYEITRIPDSLHAYVWMQLPIPAGQAVKDFLNKQL